jgi:hypothetical protein
VQTEIELLQQLRVDYAVLQQAKADFERSKKDGKLGKGEEADFTVWIRQLRNQVADDCRLLSGVSTNPVPADLPCNQLKLSHPTSVKVDINGESTEVEKTSRMVDQLNGSLGEFDERLLREQDRVKSRTPRVDTAASASAGGQGDGSGLEDDTGEGGQEKKKSQNSEKSEKRKGTVKGENQTAGSEDSSPGKPLGSVKSGMPDDIPDGSDDDVIARQIREAAEKETDPELRKKLWQEYRRYKGAIK